LLQVQHGQINHLIHFQKPTKPPNIILEILQVVDSTLEKYFVHRVFLFGTRIALWMT